MNLNFIKKKKIQMAKQAPKGLAVSSSSVQSLSRVQLFAPPWTAARQANISFQEHAVDN